MSATIRPPVQGSYASKPGAAKAARKELGADAKLGEDYLLHPDGEGRWGWSEAPRKLTAVEKAMAGQPAKDFPAARRIPREEGDAEA